MRALEKHAEMQEAAARRTTLRSHACSACDEGEEGGKVCVRGGEARREAERTPAPLYYGCMDG
jgi:hypothetical protein